jgi:hypothetical protein
MKVDFGSADIDTQDPVLAYRHVCQRREASDISGMPYEAKLLVMISLFEAS